jgi:hypothetical protein
MDEDCHFVEFFYLLFTCVLIVSCYIKAKKFLHLHCWTVFESYGIVLFSIIFISHFDAQYTLIVWLCVMLLKDVIFCPHMFCVLQVFLYSEVETDSEKQVS